MTEIAARDVTQAVSAATSPAPSRPSRSWTEIGTEIGDRVYSWSIVGFASLVPILLLVIFIAVGLAAWPALRTFGFSFITSSDWDPVAKHFGAAPAIYGTLVSSIIALIVATPLALGVAIFLTEFAPPWLKQPVAFMVDLLAAVPSVIYGVWGMFVLVPMLRQYVMPFLRDTLHLGVLPLFSGAAYGPSMLAAGLILAIMCLPYISAVTREVLSAVPRSQKEAALALGATRWEVIRDAIVPYARSGIIGGIMLGLGRALGETMAVTMLIGNRHEIAASLFAPGYTMASLIANEFSEASGDLHLSALMAVGFVLLLVTFLVNAIARWLVWQTARER
ncbi:MAG TPA: phosphate ABC transporter permease subunit PstC [Gemmatimonadaceae bacterium]|nr:phosphate ABC transporter permease subunit PstC [Gemmatimonadaceae bacterium]